MDGRRCRVGRPAEGQGGQIALAALPGVLGSTGLSATLPAQPAPPGASGRSPAANRSLTVLARAYWGFRPRACAPYRARTKGKDERGVGYVTGNAIAGHRVERRIEMAFKIAHFPMVRELADFDFKAQPSVDRRQVRELATSRWVAHGDALLVLGPPGVGKTHLAIALGREAIRQRYSVLFTTAQALMAALGQGAQRGSAGGPPGLLRKAEAIDLRRNGDLPFEAHAAHLFFQLVSRRYERGSMLITSNRSVGEWGEVFGDAVVATAILDRRDPPRTSWVRGAMP